MNQLTHELSAVSSKISKNAVAVSEFFAYSKNTIVMIVVDVVNKLVKLNI